MGLLSQIDVELQKDLIDFVKVQQEKPYPHVLGDDIVTKALESIINGDARLSGCITKNKKKTMYLELTFFENEE